VIDITGKLLVLKIITQLLDGRNQIPNLLGENSVMNARRNSFGRYIGLYLNPLSS